MRGDRDVRAGGAGMPTSQIQPLSDVARAAAAGEAVDDTRTGTGRAPQPSDVAMATRLDFAVLLTEAERAALPRPDSPFGPLPELPAVLYAAWRIRIDLYRTFDISTAAGLAGLWCWAIADGRREIDVMAARIAEARGLLASPAPPPCDGRPPVGFPWSAALLWCARPDLQQAYPVAAAPGAAAYLGWFLRRGVCELRCGDLLPDDHVAILAAAGDGSAGPPLTRYLEFVHAFRDDLRATFDIAAFEGRRSLIKWFFDQGVREFPAHPSILSEQTRIVYAWGEALRQKAAGQQPEPGPAG